MRNSGELAGAWRDVATPSPVTVGRSGGPVDANALYGIAVGCLLSLPFWVVVGTLLGVVLH